MNATRGRPPDPTHPFNDCVAYVAAIGSDARDSVMPCVRSMYARLLLTGLNELHGLAIALRGSWDGVAQRGTAGYESTQYHMEQREKIKVKASKWLDYYEQVYDRQTTFLKPFKDHLVGFEEKVSSSISSILSFGV